VTLCHCLTDYTHISHHSLIHRSSDKGKGKVESDILIKEEKKMEEDEDVENISEDWDEEEIQLAVRKSRYS
jgi:hypothetical protein